MSEWMDEWMNESDRITEFEILTVRSNAPYPPHWAPARRWRLRQRAQSPFSGFEVEVMLPGLLTPRVVGRHSSFGAALCQAESEAILLARDDGSRPTLSGIGRFVDVIWVSRHSAPWMSMYKRIAHCGPCDKMLGFHVYKDDSGTHIVRYLTRWPPGPHAHEILGGER